jgi:hypothetical protein
VILRSKWSKIVLDKQSINLFRRFFSKAEHYFKTGQDKEKIDAWIKRINRGCKK